MKADFLRDAAMTAAIFGFFGMVWFGWAQEAPPAAARKFLAAGSILSVGLAITAGILASQHWNDGTTITPQAGRQFGIIVGVEVPPQESAPPC